jgi:hypothetical protein
MKLLVAGFFAFSGVAFAAHLAPATYHDGTLVSFPTQSAGSNCSGVSQPICSNDYQAEYMVKSEGILYALTPANAATGGFAERTMLGWSKAFGRTDSLYRQQPGTPLLLRDDGRHLFVKVGGRESKYMAIEAR